MTYEEILEVLGQHEYSKRAFENSYGIAYDCECGERFMRSFAREHSGHSEHLAEKLVEAGMGTND